MKILAFLGVKDEVELVEAAINHLRSIGVDMIVVLDVDSTDGTKDILDKYKSETFWVIHLKECLDLEAESKLVKEYLNLTNADWAIFLDADEFWIPATGNLKDCTALTASSLVSVDRFNVPLHTSGLMKPSELTPQHYDKLMLYVEPIPKFFKYIYENPETPWIRGVPVPKVMVRSSAFGALKSGAHNVVGKNGVQLIQSRANDLIIAHIPFSTLSRFKQKINNVRKEFPDGPDVSIGTPQIAWHWRRWLVLSEQGKLEEEFQRQFVDDIELLELRNNQVVRSASEVFEERYPRQSDDHNTNHSGTAHGG